MTQGNRGATDAGVGNALLTTKIRLAMKAVKRCFWVMLFVFTVWMGCWFYFYTTTTDLSVIRLHIWSWLLEPYSLHRWFLDAADHTPLLVTAEDEYGNVYPMLNKIQALWLVDYEYPVWENLIFQLKAALAFSILSYFLTWYGLSRYGRRSQQKQRIRGAKSVCDAQELNRLVWKRGNVSSYTFAKVCLPAQGLMDGLLVQGAQGSGKSLVIHDLMQQVFRNKDRKCIIYDTSGEYYRAYFRPGKDFFFSPAYEGSVPWSIFSELRYQYDADTLASAFLPHKGGVHTGANAFFEDAARALFSVILLRLKERGIQNTRDISKAILEFTDDEMEELIKHSVASSAIAGDSKGQRQGVISSISIYLNGIAAVQPGNWSLSDFLDRDDDARLFILSPPDKQKMFSPLFRLMLTIAFDKIASKGELIRDDKYWFFLDELHTIGDIRLDEAVATLRKHGVCILAGLQADSQLVSSIGSERAETLMNCVNTFLCLRNNEANTLERAAKRFNKMEVNLVTGNQALAVTEARDGAGLSSSLHEDWVVMPGEISALDKCEGFLKIQDFPVTRVNYNDWRFGHWFWRQFGLKPHASRFDPIQKLPPISAACEVEQKPAETLERVQESIKGEKQSASAANDDSVAADKVASNAHSGHTRRDAASVANDEDKASQTDSTAVGFIPPASATPDAEEVTDVPERSDPSPEHPRLPDALTPGMPKLPIGNKSLGLLNRQDGMWGREP